MRMTNPNPTHTARMRRALALDLQGCPEIRSAVRERLPLEYLARLVRQETPACWHQHLDGGGDVLIADALQELLAR